MRQSTQSLSERSVTFNVSEEELASHECQLEHPDSPPPPREGSTSPKPDQHKEHEEGKGGEVDRNGNGARKPKKKGRSYHRKSSSDTLHSKNLRSNLMRTQTDRDPLFFYEIVETLGVGSMGSVACVRKREDTIGGSARREIQEAVRRQRQNQKCLQIPILGNLFRICIDPNLKTSRHSSSLTLSTSHGSERSYTGTNSHRSNLTLSDDSSGRNQNRELHSSMRSSATSDASHASHASSSNNVYAMKSIHLNRVNDETFVTELKNEIDILRELDHPNIVRAIETFSFENRVYIIMELCSGGDLYSRDPYTEDEAARIVNSILSAVSYMHSRNVAHRDLKYENILFVDDTPYAEIKLIDFGLSKIYGDNAQLTDGVGTIYTMAPEVLKGKYTQKADLWSIGVIAYMLMSSQMPFYGRKRRHIVEQILSCKYDFRGRRWRRASEQSKQFIQDLLVLDPEERADAERASSSVWLNRRYAATTRAATEQEESTAHDAMQRYTGYSKLKKVALMVVAHKSNTEEIGILKKLFKKFDSRKDGSISFEEFSEALSKIGLSEEELRDMFDAVDLDGSGRIRYTEFLAATIEAKGEISEERLAECFDRLDSDDSGYISAENLAEILGSEFPKEEIQEIIREADTSHDNKISYGEFLALWETKQEEEREEQLRELDDPRIAYGGVQRNSTSELQGLSILENTESAQARVSFIAEKHRPSGSNRSERHVGFIDPLPEDPVD